MPDFRSEDIEIYVDEFWDACSRSEKEELIDLIEEKGLVKRIGNSIKDNISLMEQEHLESCEIISNSYIRMSSEELEIIQQLAKKYKF